MNSTVQNWCTDRTCLEEVVGGHIGNDQKFCVALGDLSQVMKPSDWLRFVQLDPFAKKWTKLGFEDNDLKAPEVAIMSLGDRAPVIRGTGGLRKIQISPDGLNKGKREAFRVCYTLFPAYGIVLLAIVYGKTRNRICLRPIAARLQTSSRGSKNNSIEG